MGVARPGWLRFGVVGSEDFEGARVARCSVIIHVSKLHLVVDLGQFSFPR